MYKDKPPAPVVFDRPGVVVIGCNIHDRMVACIYVADTPFFATTGGDGEARIGGLVPGAYRVEVAPAAPLAGLGPGARAEVERRADAGEFRHGAQATVAHRLRQPLVRAPTLQARILFFVLLLFALTQSVTFASVTAASWRAVNRQIDADLEVSARVLRRFVDERSEQLVLNARLLSGDFAFKRAYAGDHRTLLSAVTNLLGLRKGQRHARARFAGERRSSG